MFAACAPRHRYHECIADQRSVGDERSEEQGANRAPTCAAVAAQASVPRENDLDHRERVISGNLELDRGVDDDNVAEIPEESDRDVGNTDQLNCRGILRIQRIVILEQIGAHVRADLPAIPCANRPERLHRLLSTCAERHAVTVTRHK